MALRDGEMQSLLRNSQTDLLYRQAFWRIAHAKVLIYQTSLWF